MKRNETLRGRGSFDQLFARGRRVEGKRMRCLFECRENAVPPVVVGFAVPRRAGNAVKRNRIRRLMREACRMEYPALCAAAAETEQSFRMIFVYRSSEGQSSPPPSFATVHDEIARLCRTVTSSTCKVRR